MRPDCSENLGGVLHHGAVTQVALVVHGHFYQPPRENPWTETVAPEPSAAPFHDWNERVTAECYRPNGWARIADEHERVVALVNNYAHLSFDLGPTLAAWLAENDPAVLARIVEGDATSRGGIAQAYNHLILPLANERDIRTQVRWGLADFRHRFGRDATGMWLPETAVNDAVLRVLAEEGVRFTILAPSQAASDVDVRRTYRWRDAEDASLGVDIVFYEGALSHDVAFGMRTTSAQILVGRVLGAAPGGGLVCVATDGETFGHHHPFSERAIAYALPVEAPRRGVAVTTVAAHLEDHPPEEDVAVRESSWSCVHGVERWRADCGCSTGGAPGSQQRWRGPLREALDVIRDASIEVFDRRAGKVLHDPWGARDDYIDVVLGSTPLDEFAGHHVAGGHDELVEALTLLEQQRHAMLMYTSCGWFFWDLAGIETIQILRYAARALDLLEELDEDAPTDDVLAVLGAAQSNHHAEGSGRDIWERHVVPSRVDAARVVAHVALADLLEQQRPGRRLASFDVQPLEHRHSTRGSVSLCAGVVEVTHRRTLRRTQHAYAALHLGGLEVTGAVRPSDGSRDAEAIASLGRAFDHGERVIALLRQIVTDFGPSEFGLEAALPDAADQIVAGAARALEERFAATYERLVDANRTTFRSLATAGFPLSEELRTAVEVSFDRRLESALWSHSWDGAVEVAQEALEIGLRVGGPRAREALAVSLGQSVEQAIAGDAGAVDASLALLRLAGTLGIGVDLRQSQELLYAAIISRPTPSLDLLGAAFGLAVERLGEP